jgi:hypothetical protein
VAPRFSADFNYPLSYERPFKFPRHLVGPLGIDNKIAMSDLNILSTIFKLTQTEKYMDRNTDRDTDKDTDTDTDVDIKCTYGTFLDIHTAV